MDFKNFFNINNQVNCLQSEQFILGTLMLDDSVYDKVSSFLTGDDFYFKNHRIIFNIILSLLEFDNFFDIIKICDILTKQNGFNWNLNFNYLNFLIQKVFNPFNINKHINIIRNASILRKLLFISENLLHEIYNIKNFKISELIDKFENNIYEVENDYYLKNNSNFSLIGPIFDKAFDSITSIINNVNNISGISTGFSNLDNILSGLHKGELIIIAGRPSMGKTSLSMNIAQHISVVLKQIVVIFSIEMSSMQLATRFLSSISNIDQHNIRCGNLSSKELLKIKKIIKRNYLIKIFIDESSNLTPTEVFSKSKKIIKQYGEVSLIIIDYLQLMNSSNLNQNRVSEISDISRSLKCLAKDLDIPIIAISQLNRSLESRGNKKPVMSDLRESGAIEQDADVILFIYRDEVYHSASNNINNDKGLAEIIIAKQRNGPTGSINLFYIPTILKFVE